MQAPPRLKGRRRSRSFRLHFVSKTMLIFSLVLPIVQPLCPISIKPRLKRRSQPLSNESAKRVRDYFEVPKAEAEWQASLKALDDLIASWGEEKKEPPCVASHAVRPLT